MNHTVTSRKEILAASRQLITADGISTISMRGVAKACGIAVGSIYNYFPSKTDLILATVEEVWKEIFYDSGWQREEGFVSAVQSLFQGLSRGIEQCPSFFVVHAVGFDVTELGKARELMGRYFGHIQQGLLQVLISDKRVHCSVLNGGLSAEALVEFVFQHLIALLMRRGTSCQTLLEILIRLLYMHNAEGGTNDASNYGNGI